MRKIFNRGDRREMNKRKYHNMIKKWWNMGDRFFWGGRSDCGKRKEEEHDVTGCTRNPNSWKEILEHGGGIWTLKKNKESYHKANEFRKMEKHLSNKARRREDKIEVISYEC